MNSDNPISPQNLGLFEGFGIETEYMILDSKTFEAKPIADKLLQSVAGKPCSEYNAGTIGWSNELALHVIEFKTIDPQREMLDLAEIFEEQIDKANEILKSHQTCLAGSGSHPFFNPATETRLWPNDQNEIYHSYDRIFGCKGHGWSNLQSIHLNLPFNGDEEFARLHTAIRFFLPLLPALFAASPVIDGKKGSLDGRLEYYARNQSRLPLISGDIIPEAVFSLSEYNEKIMQPIFKQIAPFDSEGILQEEWLNSRGTILRNSRNALEIKVLDAQENPRADCSLTHFVVEILAEILSETWQSYEKQKNWDTERLLKVYQDCVIRGEAAVINDRDYLIALGMGKHQTMTAGEVWKHLYMHLRDRQKLHPFAHEAVETVLDEGTLATRILRDLYGSYKRPALQRMLSKLCSCMQAGVPFIPG